MSNNALGRALLLSGTLLFLIGLLNGYVVQLVPAPRIGLSAHLAGVQNALVLWALGLMWTHVGLHGLREKLAAWSAIYGMYAIWLGLFLAAAWGAGRSVPIAGAGFDRPSSNAEDLTLAFLVGSGAVAITVATLLVLFGLLKAPRLQARIDAVQGSGADRDHQESSDAQATSTILPGSNISLNLRTELRRVVSPSCSYDRASSAFATQSCRTQP